MPRKPLIRVNHLPYHITGRSNNKAPFPLDLKQLWPIFSTQCLLMSMIYGVHFHGVVLMPNHFHILATIPMHDLGKVMNVFISDITRITNKATHRSGHLFQGPYHWTLINSSRYFGHALKYVYRNPVKAGLCERAEDYPFSTLYGLMGSAHLPFPIYFTESFMEKTLPWNNAESMLNWLNTPFPSDAEKIIQRGLRTRTFQQSVNRTNRRKNLLLEELL